MNPKDELRAQRGGDPLLNEVRAGKALGLSGRARRRLVADLEAEEALRRRRWIAASGLAVALALAGASLTHWSVRKDDGDPRPERSAEALVAERTLYQALDARDALALDRAATGLADEDEGVRLASLRYLARCGTAAHAPALCALMNDTAPRVRSAAIQLAGSLEGVETDERLTDVFVDPGRPLAERLLAAAGLEKRTCGAPLVTARRVLPALEDPAPTMRERAAAVLARLTGRQLPLDASDGPRLRAAWTAELAGL